jgi:hypothetical protein
MKAAPFVSKDYGARRPVEKTNPDTPLKSCHRAADTRRRETERFGGPREVAAFHNRVQHTDAGEQSRIKGHDDSESASSFQICANRNAPTSPRFRCITFMRKPL